MKTTNEIKWWEIFSHKSQQWLPIQERCLVSLLTRRGLSRGRASFVVHFTQTQNVEPGYNHQILAPLIFRRWGGF